MAQEPILGAGGIVVRGGSEPLIAVVQRRKDDAWVLPKGKLKRKESAIAAAEREVMEETGQGVVLHEFLGAISYKVGRKPKVVQFWRMQADDRPARKLTKDIKAVKWLPLESAIKKLDDPLEQIFLRNVAERTLLTTPAMPELIAEPPLVSPPMPPAIADGQPLAERPTALTLPIVEPTVAAMPPLREQRTLLPELSAELAPDPIPKPTIVEPPAAARAQATRADPSVVHAAAQATPERNVVAPANPEPDRRSNFVVRILQRLQIDRPDTPQLRQWRIGMSRRAR